MIFKYWIHSFFLEKILDSLFVNDDCISLNYIIDGAKGIIGMWLDLDKSIIYFFFFKPNNSKLINDKNTILLANFVKQGMNLVAEVSFGEIGGGLKLCLRRLYVQVEVATMCV